MCMFICIGSHREAYCGGTPLQGEGGTLPFAALLAGDISFDATASGVRAGQRGACRCDSAQTVPPPRASTYQVSLLLAAALRATPAEVLRRQSFPAVLIQAMSREFSYTPARYHHHGVTNALESHWLVRRRRSGVPLTRSVFIYAACPFYSAARTEAQRGQGNERSRFTNKMCLNTR